MNKLSFLFSLCAFLTSQALAQDLPPELIRYADLVVHNGKVLTVDENFTIAEAVAIRDGRILKVGSNAEIQSYAGPSTQKIDLGGKTVIPGMICGNADNSFLYSDLYKMTMVNGKVILDPGAVGGENLKEILANVKKFVDQAEPGTNVYVRLREDQKNITSSLTAGDLDKIAPNNPLMLSITSSEGIVNTAMLEKSFAAGLRREHFSVIKDAQGRPTGQLFGQALFVPGLSLRDWPELIEEDLKAQEDYNYNVILRSGYTTATGHTGPYPLTMLSELFHQGRLKIRIRPTLDFSRQNPLADQFIRRTPNLLNFGLGDGMIQIIGAAVGPVDGGADAGDMMTNEPKLKIHPEIGGGPYGRSKWTGTEWTGKQFADLTEAEKRETDWNAVQLLRKHGWNLGGIHNMGDGASTVIMGALLDAEKQPDIKVHNLRRRSMLDHNLSWHEKSIAMAKQLGGDKIAFGLAPYIFRQRVSRGIEQEFYQYGERLHIMQPAKDLIKEGIIVHFEGLSEGTPAMWRIQRYVTRTDPKGRVWGKRQALDRETALRCATINGAKFITEEDMLGSIEKGKYGDLVVLSADYMTVPENEIENIEVKMVIVGGNVVYEAK